MSSRTVAQRRSEHEADLGGIERLDDVARAAHGFDATHGRFIGKGSDEDEVDVVLGLEPPAGFDAVDLAGYRDVEKRDIGSIDDGGVYRVGACRDRGHHAVAEPL